MVRTQIQLTQGQLQALKEIAARQGKSIAELIRQSVDNFIRATNGVGIDMEERRRRAIAAAGKFHSGLSDISVNHDRYLVEAYGSYKE